MESKEWANIRKNIATVLSECREPVKVNSFWNLYNSKFKSLPSLTSAPRKITSRAEILSLCADVCHVFTDEKREKFVRFNSSTAATTSSRSNGDLDKTSTSKKKKNKSSQSESYTKLKSRIGRSKDDVTPLLNKEDFPELGASGGGDASSIEMAMRNHHNHHSYHPYQHPTPPQQQQQHNPGASFYNQFYAAQTARANTDPQTVMQPNQHRAAGRPAVVSRGGATHDKLNEVAKEAIERLAEAKEYVSVERVEKLVLQQFNVSRVGQLGVHNFEKVPAVRELMMARGKVNAYIHAFMRANSACTLFELKKGLENLCCAGSDFESLNCGPLQSQPLVYDYFRFPEKTTIPEMTTIDLIEELATWMRKSGFWTTQNLEVGAFLEHLQAQKFFLNSD